MGENTLRSPVHSLNGHISPFALFGQHLHDCLRTLDRYFGDARLSRGSVPMQRFSSE
jgi:hypothetical protein